MHSFLSHGITVERKIVWIWMFNSPVSVMVTVVRSAVTDISLRQPRPPPSPPPPVHSPQRTLTTSFLSIKSWIHTTWAHRRSDHAHISQCTWLHVIYLTSTAVKGQSPPCSIYLLLSKVVTCSTPIRLHWAAHLSRVHCHWPALHTLVKKKNRESEREQWRRVKEKYKGKRDIDKAAIPGVASLLYPVPWLVGASPMETRTIVTF